MGNLNAVEEDREYKYTIYRILDLVSFGIYGSCFMMLMETFNRFILLWAGESYCLLVITMFLLVFDFWVSGMRTNVQMFKNTAGLYWNDRFRPIIEVVINLVTSIYAVNRFGLSGVVLGTIASKFCFACWVEAVVLYKNLFQKNLWIYVLGYGKKLLILAICFFVGQYICEFIHVQSPIWKMAASGAVSEMIFIIVFCTVYRKSEEFQLAAKYVKRILFSRVKRKR